MEETAILWLAVTIVLTGIELATMRLVTIWFAGGTAVAFLLSLLGMSPWVQVTAFVVVSLVLLILTRPFARRYINQSHISTNVEAVPGKTGIVTEEISNLRGTGRVLLEGNEWMARTDDETADVAKGSTVQVLRVSGVKVIVKEKKEG